VKLYAWDPQKNEELKAERNVSFEQVVFHIANGALLDMFSILIRNVIRIRGSSSSK